LIYDNINFRKVDKIISCFHDQYILQSYHDPRLTTDFEVARKARNDGIYNDYDRATREETQRNVENAEYFLGKVAAISKRRLAIENDTSDYLTALTSLNNNLPKPTTARVVAEIITQDDVAEKRLEKFGIRS
jgi:uncharacterized protein (UPF0332 family)